MNKSRPLIKSLKFLTFVIGLFWVIISCYFGIFLFDEFEGLDLDNVNHVVSSQIYSDTGEVTSVNGGIGSVLIEGILYSALLLTFIWLGLAATSLFCYGFFIIAAMCNKSK